VSWFRRSTAFAATRAACGGVTQGPVSFRIHESETDRKPQEGRRLRFAIGENADGPAIETLERPFYLRATSERRGARRESEAHERRRRGSTQPSRDRGEPWRGHRLLLALHQSKGRCERAGTEKPQERCRDACPLPGGHDSTGPEAKQDVEAVRNREDGRCRRSGNAAGSTGRLWLSSAEGDRNLRRGAIARASDCGSSREASREQVTQ